MTSMLTVSLRILVMAVVITTVIIELLRTSLPDHTLGSADWTLASLIGVGVAVVADWILRRILKRKRK